MQADREELEAALHRVMPAVNVAFFTLAGASLKLDALAATAHVAVVIFMVCPRSGPHPLTLPES